MVSLNVFRDAVRAKEIASVLLRYRFDELLTKIDTPASWLVRITPAVKGNTPIWKRVRLALEELGPTFVKVGQILSTRPDILPRNLIEELEELRDNVAPVAFEKVKPLLEAQLNNSIEDLFAEFQKTPEASGSIGQIHKAILKDTGEIVAVKIQRPNIRKPVQTDFEILEWFAEQIHANISYFKPYDLPSVVQELKAGMQQELNFTLEATNAEVFNSLNQYSDKVFAPKVYSQFTTSSLLVTEWIDGTPPSDLNDSFDRKSIAEKGGHSFFSQIVMTGFFHGDPHPGNLLITQDNRICFLDWGLVGQLTQSMRYNLIDLFSACSKRDAREVSKIAFRLSQSSERINRNNLEKAITNVLFKHDSSLKKMENIGEVIFELIYVFGSHGIQVARDYTLLAKAVISIEKTSQIVDPEFNLASMGKPFINKLNWERWNPTTLSKNFVADWSERISRFADLPLDLQRFMHLLEDKKLPIVIQHKGVSEASSTIHHAFSRLSLAVIIGSLLIGSSLLINTGVKPLLWGYPAIGIIGFILSGAIGAFVAFDILKSGLKK